MNFKSISIVFVSIAILVLSIESLCIGQEYYQVGSYRLIRSHYDAGFATGIDISDLVEQHLQEFKLEPLRFMYPRQKVFIANRSIDSTVIYIMAGVYPSVEEAEEVVLKHINNLTASYQEGPVMGESIGDNAWWFGSQEFPVESIVFVRKNVFFSISIMESKGQIDILSIAKAVDMDIMNGTDYIPRTNSLNPPRIESLGLSKTSVNEGETSVLTIQATDPAGKKLFYSVNRGFQSREKENVFTIEAIRDYFPEPFFGSHILEAWVANEDNFFSKVFKTQITF